MDNFRTTVNFVEVTKFKGPWANFLVPQIQRVKPKDKCCTFTLTWRGRFVASQDTSCFIDCLPRQLFLVFHCKSLFINRTMLHYRPCRNRQGKTNKVHGTFKAQLYFMITSMLWSVRPSVARARKVGVGGSQVKWRDRSTDRLTIPLSGAFAKLRKATISFVMSVRPSAWNKSAPTGRIFMKFGEFSKICCENSGFVKIWQE
jgi:hypothetical protein